MDLALETQKKRCDELSRVVANRLPILTGLGRPGSVPAIDNSGQDARPHPGHPGHPGPPPGEREARTAPGEKSRL